MEHEGGRHGADALVEEARTLLCSAVAWYTLVRVFVALELVVVGDLLARLKTEWHMFRAQVGDVMGYTKNVPSLIQLVHADILYTESHTAYIPRKFRSTAKRATRTSMARFE